MFYYIERLNKNLVNYLESLRYSDMTEPVNLEELGSSYKKIAGTFKEVLKDIHAERIQKEERSLYLNHIIQNLDIGILVYHGNGKVEMCNNSFKRIFQIHSLNHVNDLDVIDQNLSSVFLNIKREKGELIKVQDEDDILQLSIHGTDLVIDDKEVILATVKDLQNVLEDKETEAWQKLIRVLTHEIMNSITPIASLSSTIKSNLDSLLKENKEQLENSYDIETFKEIQKALSTINNRSHGLVNFVDSYRNLTKIPKPDFKIIRIADLFDHVKVLLEDEITNSNIAFEYSIIPTNLELSADENLIQQVMINLVKNAIQALDNKKSSKVEIRAFHNKRGRVTIQVIDNGKGILKDVMDKIFIPFFTTKPKGTGIGLSLTKQIMRLHGGTISANSILDVGT
ncbi:PAS domain-containing sensor histidine kinase, partial [Bacteroidota bacterium]